MSKPASRSPSGSPARSLEQAVPRAQVRPKARRAAPGAPAPVESGSSDVEAYPVDGSGLDAIALNRDSLASQAYAQLRRGLMNGRYRPGQKLIVRTLTDQLDISPTPIREALARLVSEQALVQTDRRSVRVPDIDVARWREVRDLRLELEAMGARLAAEHASKAQIDGLQAEHDAMVRAKQQRSFQKILEHNERFHHGLCRAAGRPVLLRILEGLWLQSGPLLNALKYSAPVEYDRHAHLTVIRGLRTRNAELAAKGIRADIMMLDETLLARLEQTTRIETATGDAQHGREEQGGGGDRRGARHRPRAERALSS